MGISSMNGITDQNETVTVADFRTILAYAQQHHLARLTFWSVNRDRPCTGGPADTCSGVGQRLGLHPRLRRVHRLIRPHPHSHHSPTPSAPTPHSPNPSARRIRVHPPPGRAQAPPQIRCRRAGHRSRRFPAHRRTRARERGGERGRRPAHRLGHRRERQQRQVRGRPAAATANGTAVQQYACNGSDGPAVAASPPPAAATTGSTTATTPRQVWDVTDVSTADSAPVQLWAYGGGTNQQWQPVDESGGAYHFVNRNSGKCLDVPGASTADSVQLAAVHLQRHRGPVASSGRSAAPRQPATGHPDLGPNVTVFDPSMSASTIQTRLNSVFQPAGDQPVRRPALRPAVQARHLQRRRQRRLLHPGRGPRPDPGRRHHQRRGARRGRLVPGQRHPELLARRREPVRQPHRRHRPLGGLAGGAVPPDARARQPRPGRRRLVQRRLHRRLQDRRPGQLRLASSSG